MKNVGKITNIKLIKSTNVQKLYTEICFLYNTKKYYLPMYVKTI